MDEIIAVDVGGTNARFARTTFDSDGTPICGTVRKYKVAEHEGLASCWQAFAREENAPLPPRASIGLATAIQPDIIDLTNSDWVIYPQKLAEELGVDRLELVNDFEAVGHAITRLPRSNMELLFGPDRPFPDNGAVTVLGPGTGLGVCMIAYNNGTPHIIATEGGHIDFAPLDETEVQLRAHFLRTRTRMSTERIVSGPGLNTIYQGLVAIAGADAPPLSDADLWDAALNARTPLAHEALERLCLAYGAVAGDLALAHGPSAVVLAGGLTQRMKSHLLTSGFHDRFTTKGRFSNLMEQTPVRLAMHDEIGLFGAAAAYAAKHL